MAINPNQVRMTDPYSGRRLTDTVNRYSRLMSGIRPSVILHPMSSFRIEYINSNTLRILPGIFIRHDIVVHINETYELGFSTNSAFNYIERGDLGMDQTGRYIICIDYTYSRATPPPQAYYRIIKTLSNYSPDRYVYIGSVEIVYDASSGSNVINPNSIILDAYPGRPDICRPVAYNLATCYDPGELS